jgi:integrase
MASKCSEWRNDVHRGQWRQTLEVHAKALWDMPVNGVDTAAVLAVLQPLWSRTPETASRLRGRIEAVLDAARAHGLIEANQANPARWKGHLDKLLPRRQKLSRGHHAAMPYGDVPGFLRRLRWHEGIADLALEFLILTAARSGEVLGGRWDEVDLESKIWTIPAARMKGGTLHRVPLSGRAVAILEQLINLRVDDFVFPGQRRSKGLASSSLILALKRIGADCTVHGFRSSFRDWAGETTNFPREICEAALAHVTGNAVEAAYRRGDALVDRL